MQLNKILYDIRESVKEYVDDTELDDRYILHLLNIKRAKYLRQELNNSQRTSDTTVLQTLTVGLQSVSQNECNVGISCDQLMRTCKVIPDALQLHTKDAITRVASVDRMSKPFNYISRDRVLYTKDSSFPGSIYAFLHDDGYIYLTSTNNSIRLLDCISITGIFEDPMDLNKFKTCCNCNDTKSVIPINCFSMEDDYPIQPHLLDIIIEEITLKLIRTKQIPEDKVNDGNN